jgi:hypothetical protein
MIFSLYIAFVLILYCFVSLIFSFFFTTQNKTITLPTTPYVQCGRSLNYPSLLENVGEVH